MIRRNGAIIWDKLTITVSFTFIVSGLLLWVFYYYFSRSFNPDLDCFSYFIYFSCDPFRAPWRVVSHANTCSLLNDLKIYPPHSTIRLLINHNCSWKTANVATVTLRRRFFIDSKNVFFIHRMNHFPSDWRCELCFYFFGMSEIIFIASLID